MIKPDQLFVKRRRMFPDPAETTIDGIVAMGNEVNTETLLEAYSFGIFPWPHPDLPCLWFCPEQRGVLDFSDLHVSQSLAKFLRKTNWRITFNQDFKNVMLACAEVPRPGQTGTWITDYILNAYVKFHEAGYAHSVECWDGNDLVGGLYGVYVAGSFSGESMFFKKSNASKICLLAIIEKLHAKGLTWMDIQMVTPGTEQMGGKYISKREFLARLARSKQTAQPLDI